MSAVYRAHDKLKQETRNIFIMVIYFIKILITKIMELVHVKTHPFLKNFKTEYNEILNRKLQHQYIGKFYHNLTTN